MCKISKVGLWWIIFSLCLVACTTHVNSPSAIESQSPTVPNLLSETPTFKTPTQTSPVSPTATPIPLVATPEIPTATEQTYLGRNIILLESIGTGHYKFLDIETGQGRTIDPLGKVVVIISWVDNGCNLVVMLPDFRIAKIDLQGNINRILYNHEIERNHPDEAISRPYPSPNLDWIYFKRVTGDWIDIYENGETPVDVRYEHEDLFTLDLNDPLNTYPISVNSGAYHADWSPDGKWLAYQDFTDEGKPAVFVSDVFGQSKSLITEFDSTKYNIRQILWSPDGSRLAIISELDAEDPRTISTRIVGIDDKSKIEMEYFQLYWWKDAFHLLGFDRADGELSIKSIDGQQEEKLTALSQYGIIYWINHYQNPNKIGFYSDETFAVYDLETQSVTAYPNGYTGRSPYFEFINGWTAPPDSFRGEAYCQ